MSDWQNFGYKTDKPCDVCGKTGNNQSEPRFGYVVCEEHYKMTPLQVMEAREKRLKTDEMSVSQRLQEIENKYDFSCASVPVGVMVIESKDFRWLVEQAKKIEQMQQEIERLNSLYQEREKIAVELAWTCEDLDEELREARAEIERIKHEAELLGKYANFLKNIIKTGGDFDEHKHHFEWFCRMYSKTTTPTMKTKESGEDKE